MSKSPEARETDIAIIGLAGRFPGARTVEGLWHNLRHGVESIVPLSDQELRAAGVADDDLKNPSYVKAAPRLADIERFDAGFFHLSPRDAELMDPQQRLFLECAWEALENAGYDVQRHGESIGVFAASGANSYLLNNLMRRPGLARAAGAMQLLIGNDKDYLATRTSYELDLMGPSINVQTACSSSLVAVHLACQSLLDGQCDLALAGGVRIQVPQDKGYWYQEDGIASPDGHCRAFDAEARGTVFGSGLGLVVLKPLTDALADGDFVHAVIKGTAVNNDGGRKVGFTAPGVQGQMGVVAEALEVAEVEAETITYIETHGTGTQLGDPIEVRALAEVFRAKTSKTGFCALGSLKTNIGHLDTAAGIAGLIKGVLALEHQQIPPSLHFNRPNPQIDFASTPFYVNHELRDWTSNGSPRRCGVSSFGIGGTNAHIILEEAPAVEGSLEPLGGNIPGSQQGRLARPWQLLLLSAKTNTALDSATRRLAESLETHPSHPLADVAFTLQVGRKVFEHRRMVLCRNRADALEAIQGSDPQRVLSYHQEAAERPVVFMFSGQGAQYAKMGRELYLSEPVFRQQVDRCCELLRPHLDTDLRHFLYPQQDHLTEEEADEALRQTRLTQPALFVVEYALAKLWMSWGMVPAAMIGHSIGEYVAACLAGVFDLEDALALVAMRGRLVQELPAGAMLAVPLAEEETRSLLGSELDLAAINGPALCVVSGPAEAVERCRQELSRRGHEARRLHTSHAFHSRVMEEILKPFRTEVEKRLRRASGGRTLKIPFLSNLTGTWIEAAEASDAEYWTSHLRQPVRFAEAIEELAAEPARIFLEVGPGRTLSTLVRRHPATGPGHMVLSSLPRPQDRHQSAANAVQKGLGRLWLAGATVDWQSYSAHRGCRRLPLPTYPFERQRYWVDPPARPHPRPGETPGSGRTETTHQESPDATEGATEHATEHPPNAEQPAATTAYPRPLLENEYVAPTSEAEGRVVEIWQQLLGIAPVGVHDNFFDLGGHSLLAVQLSNRLREAFRVDLPLRRLLDAPSPARMAGLLEEQRAEVRDEDSSLAALPTITPDAKHRHQPFPLTDVQQAYWLGRSGDYELGNVATHSYQERDIEQLDLARLTTIWRHLIDRHDMLRAVILPDGRQQILAEVPPYEIKLLDLRGEDPEATAASLRALRQQMSHQVLPSDQWPLFEIRASRWGADRFRLHVSFDFLIGDVWSWRLLLREQAQLYRDPERSLPPLELSFRDYVLALEELKGSALYERSLEYWRRRLPTLPPAPELPLATSPGALERPRFVRRRGQLNATAWGRLKARAQGAGLTPSGVVLAVYAEALAAWSKKPAFTLNLTLFNRLPLHPEIDRIVGDCTSLTLLAVEFVASEPFEERARRLQNQLWDDLDHRYVSGVWVQRQLARQARSRPGAATMPVVFTSTLALRRETTGQRNKAARPAKKDSYSISQTPQIWLDHQVSEIAGELRFNWDAVEDLFPQGLLDDMFAAYTGLLEQLADDEESWNAVLPDLVPKRQLVERRQINATAAPVPSGLLHSLFFDQIAHRPEQSAVVTAGSTLSYRQLGRLAESIGRRLRARQARPNTLVAVVMEKGWQQVPAVLGVLTSGAAYLPIDAGLPAQRIRDLLELGEVRLALTEKQLLEELDWPQGVEPLAVEDVEEEAATNDGAPLLPIQGPEDLAYVIFTSGSTGTPKGVMIDHRGAVNTIHDINQRFAVGPEDRVLALSSLSFDLSVYDLFGLLAAGGTVVIPEVESTRDPDRWWALMEAEGVTLWNTVPALMQMLVEATAGQERKLPQSLRLALLSGDWIPLDLPAQIHRLAAEVQVVSLGGATEASIWSILFPIGEVDAGWKSIPYGRPMMNQGFQVLDERLEPRPVWVPGQLYISGLGLAQGYWRNEEKTAASFLVHPRTAERLYRTGDLGRYLPSGDIEFLGREDFQVKVRGHRIELGEIEAALTTHPAVRTALAGALGERFGHKRLVAWVVPEGDVTGDELAAFLTGRLAAYMIPTAFVFLDTLPLTATGKVDRRALPAPQGPSEEQAEQFTSHTAPHTTAPHKTAPRNPIEETTVGIWEDLLGVESLGIEDDFFALGGDSLLATRAVNRLREAFAVEVPLRSFFDSPTVAALAREIETARAAAGGLPQAPAIRRQPRNEPLPLSFAQERLWLLEQMHPGSAGYNEPFPIRLRGPLEVEGLRLSLHQVVHRHEVLRTTFLSREGCPFQVATPQLELALPVADLGGVSSPRRWAETLRLAKEEARRPFDLERGPLLRTTLLRLHDDEHVLLLTLHHIVFDAWSIGILMRELKVLYRSYTKAGSPAPLPELPVHYADFAAWQRRWFEGELLEQQLAYWREQLAPHRLSALRLPTDRPRPAVKSYRGGRVALDLPDELTHELKALSRRAGATLFMTLLAGFAALLHRYSGQDTLAIGTPLANRNRVEIEPLIGFFINTLVLSTDLSGNPTFKELIQRARKVALDAYAHQDIPFERLVGELNPERQTNYTPFFQVMFVLQNTPEAKVRSADEDLRMDFLAADGRSEKFDLTLWIDQRPQSLKGGLYYDTDLFDTATVAEMAERLTNLLWQMVNNPEERLLDVSLDVTLDGSLDAEASPKSPEELPAEGQFVFDRRTDKEVGHAADGRRAPKLVFDARLKEEKDYWVTRLSATRGSSHLLPDSSRKGLDRTTRSTRESPVARSEVDFRLPQETWEGLCRLTQETPFLLYVALMAALKIYLSKTSGEGSIVVGSPAYRGEKSAVAANALAIIDHVDPALTFQQFLPQVRATLLEAYARQSYPLGLLLGDLQLTSAADACPLFDVALMLEEIHSEFPEVGQDVTLLFFRRSFGHRAAGTLLGCIEFNSELFERASIQRFANQFKHVLHQALEDFAKPLGEFTLVDAGTRHQLLSEWNDTALRASEIASPSIASPSIASPSIEDVYRLFAAQAERTPEAVAVVFGDQQLSYRELGRRARRLGRRLAARGVRPEVPVGISVERSPEMTTAVLGTLAAGGVLVPLDPGYPAERLAFMLEDSAVPVVVVQEHLAERWAELAAGRGVHLLHLEVDAPADDHALSAVTRPDNLFYVIFTSGSTGRPKGVELSHRALVNLLGWHVEHLLTGVRTLQFASLNFDVSFYEMFLTWATGGTLYLVPEALRTDVPALARFLAEQRIEKAILPVTVLHLLTEVAGDLKGLREVISTGEQLQVTPALRRWFEAAAGCRLHNHYGPSESHVATAFKLPPQAADWPYHPPIGRPVDNSRIYLLDRHGAPVPAAVSAELYIAGHCLARGYTRRPGLTAERFLPDPFGGPGTRAYRSGDLARWRPDGCLEFLGRADHQLKIRGFRVEPGEIEAVLVTHPGVREAVVIRWPESAAEGGDRAAEGRETLRSLRLVAYLVADQDAAPSVGELRDFLLAKLPEYMVPAAFVSLEALPLNPNGKVDRRALPAPDPGRPELAAAFVAPRCAAEEVVAGVWARLLQVEKISVHDDFFNLGGHSLLATQAMARLNQIYRSELPLLRLFEKPTVEGLTAELANVRGGPAVLDEISSIFQQAEELSRATPADTAKPVDTARPEQVEIFDQMLRQKGLDLPHVPEIPRRPGGTPPLSFAQERLWILDQLEPGSVAYNLLTAFNLRSTLNRPALERAWHEVCRRHETLRTTFTTVDGEPVQLVSAHTAVPTTSKTPLIDLRHLAAAAKSAEVRRLAAREVRDPLDLRRGPLWRTSLLRLGTATHVLLITLHHAIADGWSIWGLGEELATLYQAFAHGQPSPLAPLPIQYGDFARWQREWMGGEVLERELSYWSRQLEGAPALLALPTDHPRPPVQTLRGATRPFAVSSALHERLDAVSRGQGATLFMGLLTAFKVLLRCYTGEDDLVVGTDIAGRNRRQLENLIGLFVNNLALRTDLSGDPTFRQLLGRVREVTLGAYAHQDLPFFKLVEALPPRWDRSHHPVFQVMLVLHNFPSQKRRGKGGSEDTGALRPLPIHGGSAKFDLTLYLVETADGLSGLLEYNTDLFRAATMDQMLEHLHTVLEHFTADPDAPLSSLSLTATDSEEVDDWLADFLEEELEDQG